MALKAIDPKRLAETTADGPTRSIEHLYLVGSQCTTNKRCEDRQMYRPDSSLDITDHMSVAWRSQLNKGLYYRPIDAILKSVAMLMIRAQ